MLLLLNSVYGLIA